MYSKCKTCQLIKIYQNESSKTIMVVLFETTPRVKPVRGKFSVQFTAFYYASVNSI